MRAAGPCERREPLIPPDKVYYHVTGSKLAFILPLPTLPGPISPRNGRKRRRSALFQAAEPLAEPRKGRRQGSEVPEMASKTAIAASIERHGGSKERSGAPWGPPKALETPAKAHIEAEIAAKSPAMAGIEGENATPTPSGAAPTPSDAAPTPEIDSETVSIVVREARSDLITGHAAVLALDARAERAAEAARPANTTRAYEMELACFASWALRHHVRTCPAEPQVVRAYLRDLADHGRTPIDLPRGRPRGPLGFSALMRALAAICSMHVKAGHGSLWKHPIITEARDTHGRELGTAPKSQKRDLGAVLLGQVCDLMDDNLIGIRDRAMILIGWEGGGRRRSEIAAAQLDHFEPIDGTEHLKWKIPRSKTDQTGAGLVVPLTKHENPAYCPVRALGTWLVRAEITSGPVLRGILPDGTVSQEGISPELVSIRVKHYVERLGLDPKHFGGHSIRSGLITTAYRQGRKLADIMEATGHRKAETVMGYIRRAGLLEDSATKGLMDEIAPMRKGPA